MTDKEKIRTGRYSYKLDYHEDRYEYLERSVLGLVPEQFHSEKSAETSAAGGKQQEGLFRDPPFAFLCLGLIHSVKYEGYGGHYCVKHKKNLHVYIIIFAMNISNRKLRFFGRLTAAALCLAMFFMLSSCSILDDGDLPGESGKNTESDIVTGDPSDPSGNGRTVLSSTGPDSGYEKVSGSYVYCAWYDVEKDNPVDYTSIDSNDAYALKCVFYFSEPVNATFRAVLHKDGKQVAEKTIRIDNKVVAEFDFSAGLEGKGMFEPGTYKVYLETEGKNVASSTDMRVN